MGRKWNFGLLCLGAVVVWATGCGTGGDTGDGTENGTGTGETITVARKHYNVLLVTMDTLRRDRLSIYSDRHVKTPNIDGLARRSVVFDRAFSHNPATLPAHTNIMLGTTPRFHGIGDNSGFRLHDRFLTLAEHLKAAGYRTGAFLAAFPLDSRFGLNQGFDVYDDHYGTHNEREFFFVERPAEKVIEPALRWLDGQKSNDKWFTWIHLFDPHQPYLPPAPYDSLYRKDAYSGEVAYMDACLKELFDYLGQKGYMENTVIVLTADHGEALGEKGEETHAYFAYNNTIHIPLILYVPGLNPAPDTAGGRLPVEKRVAANVCHADIFPTLSDLLGLDIPSHIQGESLLPLIETPGSEGARGMARRTLYFESLTPWLNRGWAPLRGLVRGDIKYIDLPIAEVYDIARDHRENHNLLAEHSGKHSDKHFDKTVDGRQLGRDMVKLKRDLKGPFMMERSRDVSAEVKNKLESLGYLSGGGGVPERKTFTAADDLKVMLPLQNRMLAAVAQCQEGKYDEALAGLRSVLDESPAFILVYRHMATAYTTFGRMDKAVEILEEGLRKNPGNASLMSRLGIVLAESNRPDEAIELLNLCIQKRGFDPEDFNYLGVAYYKKGNFSRALENYRRALSLDENYASVYNNIGSMYLAAFLRGKDRRAYDLAMENFNRALALDPRLFAAYNGRGAAYKFTKRVDLAIADWRKAIEINPDFSDAYFNVGISYLQKGDKKSALEYFVKCRDRLGERLIESDRRRLGRLIGQARQ